jgi:hypothetical protein
MRGINFCVLLFLITTIASEAGAELRGWTDATGRAIQAELVAVDGTNVTIVRDDGLRFTVPVDTFSAEDRLYVKNWIQRNAPEMEGAPWPNRVQVQAPRVEVVEESGASNIYRTEHFEFRAEVRLSRSLVAEFGQIFEATFAAVRALPLPLEVRPPEGGFFPHGCSRRMRNFAMRAGYRVRRGRIRQRSVKS